MKKLMLCFVCFVLFICGGTVKAASSPTLTVEVKGNIEVDQTIQILINVDKIDNLYAGAATLKYDPKVLKIISFEKGDLIIKGGINTFDVGNKIDNTNGIASFGGFSCLGQIDGFSGSGTFFKINAQLLKKDSFHIKSQPFLASPNDVDNLKIQLCDKSIKVVDYVFKGYELKVGNEGQTEEIKPENTVAIPNTGSSTKDNTTSSVKKDSEIKPGSTVITPATNNNTKASTNSLVNKDSEIKKSVSESVSKSASKNNESTNTNALALSDENSKETKKNPRWQKSLLIVGTIVLIFAVAGGMYFYRKKHPKVKL